MPIGARKVSLDFSTASIRTTKTRIEVRNISMKRPWAIDVPAARVVLTLPTSPENMARTRPPATMDASSCDGMRKVVRSHESWPERLRPSAT